MPLGGVIRSHIKSFWYVPSRDGFYGNEFLFLFQKRGENKIVWAAGGGGGVVGKAPIVGMSETNQVCLGLLLNYTRICLNNV